MCMPQCLESAFVRAHNGTFKCFRVVVLRLPVCRHTRHTCHMPHPCILKMSFASLNGYVHCPCSESVWRRHHDEHHSTLSKSYSGNVWTIRPAALDYCIRFRTCPCMPCAGRAVDRALDSASNSEAAQGQGSSRQGNMDMACITLIRVFFRLNICWLCFRCC